MPPQSSLDPKWYVASTCSRHEKRVGERLAAEGVEYLLPLYDTVHQWRNGRKRVCLPLFPGYVFVRVPLAERTRVLRIPGVAYLLGSASGPTPLADGEISAIGELTRNGLCAAPHTYLSVGQRVKVRSGALKGLEGILVRKTDSLRLVISVDSIMRSVILEMDIAEVDIVSIARRLNCDSGNEETNSLS
jgi:transcription antitermination factor NusG